MKPPRILIGLLCLSLSLMAAIAYVQHGQRPASGPGPSPGLAASEHAEMRNEPVALLPAPEPPFFSWRQVESEDYRQYIANLRAAGCPEQTLRDIIVADITKLYASREDPLKRRAKDAPPETPEEKLERLRQLREVQQEKRWAIKELLGIEVPLDLLPSSGSRDYDGFEVAFKFLPSEKRDAVQALQETYWYQSDALKARYEKKQTPEFLVEYRQLKDSLRQELGKILTPGELDDYDMRTSSTAKQLSSKLATYFRPTEEEFRQIFRAQREHEEALENLSAPRTLPPTDPVERQAYTQQRALERQLINEARSAAASHMNEQLKTTLGEERYNEYQRSQDRTYDLLARLGVRYGVPQEQVLEAYDVQKSFQATQAASGGNQQANRAEVQRQLEDRLTTILGEQAVRGYRRVHGGAVPIN